jgi:uncharacterized protein DUF5753
LLALCREQDNPGWLQQHGDRLPKQLATLIRETGIVSPDEIEDRVAARLARQSLFSRERPARFTYYLHEYALRLPVGGPAVLAEQLAHLLRMARRPYLTLRVLPAARGGHAGIAGPFMLMEFTGLKPVAYLDSETTCLFLERPEEIAAYQRILAVLADTALDKGQSRQLIAALATGLVRIERGPDDRA